MKQRLRLTFILAALAALSIIIFQVYWEYNNFVNAQRNFTIKAINALDKSIQRYQLQQIELPTSLNYKVPSLTVFMRTKPDNEALALDTPSSRGLFKAEFNTVAIDKENINMIRALFARLITQQRHKPLDLGELTKVYKKELLQQQIDVPVSLAIRRNSSRILQGEIAVPINFYKSPVVVKANVKNLEWLVRHNLLPSLVSLLLVLLSAGSLWYMGLMISRQLKLDRLKNEFISNITHELRTPMTILRSANDAIAQFGVAADPEKLARYTGINYSILDKMENEVERILDIIQLEKKEQATVKELVDLQQITWEFVSRFELLENNRITLECSDTAFPVYTDPHKIDNILSNLIDNALKYAGPEAFVTVQIQVYKDIWQLIVRDTGKGISYEDQPYLFDKFYRVNTGDLHDIKGYGLGLSYVKGLVEFLGGQISLRSKPGKGATFTMKFKRDEQN